MLLKTPFKELSGGIGEIDCFPQVPNIDFNGDPIDPDKNATGFPIGSGVNRMGKHGMHYHGQFYTEGTVGYGQGVWWLRPDSGAEPIKITYPVEGTSNFKNLMQVGQIWPPVKLQAKDAPEAAETPQKDKDAGRMYKNYIWYKPDTYYMQYLVNGESNNNPLVSYDEMNTPMNGRQWFYTPTFGVTYVMWFEFKPDTYDLVYVKARRVGAVLDKNAGGKWHTDGEEFYEDGTPKYARDYRDDVQTIGALPLRFYPDDNNGVYAYPLDVKDGDGSEILVEWRRGSFGYRTEYDIYNTRWYTYNQYFNSPDYETFTMSWDAETGEISIDRKKLAMPELNLLAFQASDGLVAEWVPSHNSKCHVTGIPVDRPFYMGDKLCFFYADYEAHAKVERSSSGDKATIARGSVKYDVSLKYTLYMSTDGIVTEIAKDTRTMSGTDTIVQQKLSDSLYRVTTTLGTVITMSLVSPNYSYNASGNAGTSSPRIKDEFILNTGIADIDSVVQNNTGHSRDDLFFYFGSSGVHDYFSTVEGVNYYTLTGSELDALSQTQLNAYITVFVGRVYVGDSGFPWVQIHHTYQAQSLEWRSHRVMYVNDPTQKISSYYSTEGYPPASPALQGRRYRVLWWTFKGVWYPPQIEEVGCYAPYTYTNEWLWVFPFRYYPSYSHFEENPNYINYITVNHDIQTGITSLGQYSDGCRWV